MQFLSTKIQMGLRRSEYKKDSIVYEAISTKAEMIAESNLVKKVVARLFLSYPMDAPPWSKQKFGTCCLT